MIQIDLMPENRGNKMTFNSGMGSRMTDVRMFTTRFAERIKK